MKQSSRQGFTLVELLVTISIIGMMMALLLPAVMQSREAARRAHCSNNLRNVGLALQGAVSARRRLPAAGNFSTTGTTYHGWVVELLPWLERSDLARQWNLDLPVTDPKNAPLGSIQLSVLLCPDDDSLVTGRGNLSYVVNGGFGWTEPNDCPVAVHSGGGAGMQTLPFDLNGNGVTCPANAQQDGSPSDCALYFQTGLFFPENWPVGSGTVRHHSFDTIDDGLSRTIMLAENLHAGEVSGWSSPHPWGNSFYLSGYICKNAKCSPGNIQWWRANDHSQLPYSREAINGNRTGAGASPWPSSWHPDGVNAIYCDGHVSFLSQDIDGGVYASLVTPQGSRIPGPLSQPPMGDLSP